MVALTTIALLAAGTIGLFGTFALVSIVTSVLAVAGAFGVFGFVLRYLVESRPVELLDRKVPDNVLYLVFSVVLGFAAYRVFEALAVVLNVVVVFVVALLAVAMFFLGPATVLGGFASFVRLFFEGD